MNLYGPISSHVIPISNESMDAKIRRRDAILVRLLAGLSIDVGELLSLGTCTSGWRVLDLPVEVLGHILGYIDITDGLEFRNVSMASVMFSRIMGRAKTITSNIERISPLIPETIIFNATHRYITIPRCDTIIMYKDGGRSDGMNMIRRIDIIGCDTFIVESCIDNIPHLYKFLDHIKDRCNTIIIRTDASYDGLLDRPSNLVHILGPREVHLANGDIAEIDQTYEVTIPSNIARSNTLYPSGKLFRSIL